MRHDGTLPDVVQWEDSLADPDELVITFGVDPRTDEADADMVRLDGVPGLQPSDLREIEEELGARADYPGWSAFSTRPARLG